MAHKSDSEWVDRSPKKSPEMEAAYAGLATAEKAVSEAHSYGMATDDWEPHHEAITVMVEWHAEIGRVAQSGRGRV